MYFSPDDSCLSNPCHVNASCVYDNAGAFTGCQCNPGYQGDGYSCDGTNFCHYNIVSFLCISRQSFKALKIHTVQSYIKKDMEIILFASLFDNLTSSSFVEAILLFA